MVFLDESGVNTNLTRLYGRALSSQRAVDHAPLNTPQTTTVLSSIRLNGEKAFTTYQGGTTGERFVQYLKETLLPTLKPGDIVVMDNMRSHHVKAVREVLEEKGMKVLYFMRNKEVNYEKTNCKHSHRSGPVSEPPARDGVGRRGAPGRSPLQTGMAARSPWRPGKSMLRYRVAA